MDCHSVADRVAAWADGQLSPGEHELLEEHLERCPRCRALAAAISAQDLRPPSHPPLEDHLWRAMDVVLASELDRLGAPAPQEAPLVQRSHLSRVAHVLLIVALLGWGLYTQHQLQQSRATTATLRQELAREKRLAAQPSAPQEYRVASRVPQRGVL